MKAAVILTLAALFVAACTPIVSQEDLERPSPQPTQTTTSDAQLPPSERGPLPYEFVGIQQWFNLEGTTNGSELRREDLLGKVLLVDMWTYSCINCIRTLPYVTSWYEKYRDDGLVIVGIHAPEFDFEKNPDNVAAALKKYSIKYPVGLDNDMATWNNYNNHYWPHTYLFDRNGKLVFDHIGEGRYEEVERKIQELLALEADVTEVATPRFASISTPEIYLGGSTSRGNNGYDLTLGEHEFTFPEDAERNTVQLGGTWTVDPEYLVAGEDAQLRLFYHAKDIHVVAGGSGTISGTLESKSGSSILAKATVAGEQLYTLSSTDYLDHTITLSVSPGVRLYSFTFG